MKTALLSWWFVLSTSWYQLPLESFRSTFQRAVCQINYTTNNRFWSLPCHKRIICPVLLLQCCDQESHCESILKFSEKYVNLTTFTACSIAHSITYSSLNKNWLFVSHRFCLHWWYPFIFSMRLLMWTIQTILELQTIMSFPYPPKCCYLQSKCFHFRICSLRIWTCSVPHEY